MGDPHRCHVCHLDIEMRYSVVWPKSGAAGYWAHVDTLAGIAADGDHDAIR